MMKNVNDVEGISVMILLRLRFILLLFRILVIRLRVSEIKIYSRKYMRKKNANRCVNINDNEGELR